MQELADAMSERMTLGTIGRWDQKIVFTVVRIVAGVVRGPRGRAAAGLVAASATSFFADSRVFDSAQLESVREEMKRVSEEIGDVDTELGVLPSLARNAAALATRSDGLAVPFDSIGAMWKRMGDGLDSTLADLRRADGDRGRDDLAQAAVDVRAAAEEWRRGTALARQLHLDRVEVRGQSPG
ncbi:MAG: hypothetical protein GY711_03715 [bacterium]|nr:hypothetical protein [bacterium]